MRISTISPTPSSSVEVAAAHAGGGGGGVLKWNSGMPYLYAGLAMLMCVIAVALTILSYSTVKDSMSSHGNEESSQSSSSNVTGIPADAEPKIVVIMAGDSAPTYLAKKQPVQIQSSS